MMNKFAKQKITLFCRYTDEARNEYWKCIPLGEVCIARNNSLDASKYVDKIVDNFVAYLFDSELYTVVAKKQLKYKSPREFAKNPHDGFTLQVGDKIVLGNVDIDITSPKQLEREYEYVYTISSVKRNELLSSKLSHWRVGAK